MKKKKPIGGYWYVCGKPLEKKQTNYDPHPDYYNWIKGHECWEVAQHFNYNKGCALKYIWRSGRKNDEAEDLQKAINYLQQEIKRIK